ncbi:hypothetical protein TRFO_03224 [Tritrichomonas foetus]|uniref:Clathrin/coatomer adaptor adaptin-like N-terminal domain-containing protein n=1 Tax=Tritrichomonas foetus TaxID=1144522 RepID=A0A1J4KSC8_9EUKA|nr:hypothetical protein TRFO_03224 [Tritrichomonas foetus]|eukprot:OHT14163.1 hypothetical protein TRFO_03224 [Tritrichomonas foetus]
MSTNKAGDVISQYFSNIRECLSSRDNASIVAALRLLCGLLSRGYNLSEFAPLVVQHVISDLDEIESLSQMLLLQLTSNDGNSCLQAVNSLVETAEKSPREVSRIRAIKTLSAFKNEDLSKIIEACLQIKIKDESSYVQKAVIIGTAHFIIQYPKKRHILKRMVSLAFETRNPVTISGILYACDLIADSTLVIPYSDLIWSIMSLLDPLAQSRALKLLKSIPEKADKLVLNSLLHSMNASVIFEAANYYLQDPEVVVKSLIRFLFSTPAIALHAMSLLLKVAEAKPKSVAPYASYFLPPQSNEQAEFLSVNILGRVGNQCSSEYLTRWALFKSNNFAAQFIGKLGFIDGLKTLLENGSDPIAEIAAFYMAKVADDSTLASLLELEGPRSAVISVFSEVCKNNPILCELMLKLVLSNFEHLKREAITEALLLAARLFSLNNSQTSKMYFEKCLQNNDFDVSKRAKIWLSIVSSDNEKVRKVIWESKDPPPPTLPSVFIPVFE